MPSPLLDKIRATILPPIEGAGYELVEIEYKHEQVGWVVRVFIDSPGGISHDDCERVSRELSAVLDVHDVVPHHYSLEVSSPGLNRPLRTTEHFARFKGQKAKVKLRNGLDGRRNFSGFIKDAAENKVTLEVDGRDFTLPLDDLEKANLEWQFTN